ACLSEKDGGGSTALRLRNTKIGTQSILRRSRCGYAARPEGCHSNPRFGPCPGWCTRFCAMPGFPAIFGQSKRHGRVTRPPYGAFHFPRIEESRRMRDGAAFWTGALAVIALGSTAGADDGRHGRASFDRDHGGF